MLGPLALIAGLEKISHQLVSLAGPVPAAGQVLIRAQIGIPDATVTRFTEQFQQAASTDRTQEKYANTLQDVGTLIRMLHQSVPLGDDGGTFSLAGVTWDWIKQRLAWHGVDIAKPGEADAPEVAKDWLTLARMEATAAPFELVLRGWQRTRLDADELADWYQRELEFHLRRDGVSRIQDRQLLTIPFAHFSTGDAERLAWLGVIPETGRISLYRAAGHVHETDQSYSRWLHARIPDPQTLYNWARRAMFDDQLAAKYELDERFNNERLAVFFARAQGEGVMPGELPNQPEGSTDWLKLAMRAETPIVGYREAREMQHRLRPIAPGNPASVVPGVQAWTAQNTQDVLTMAGYTGPISARLLGLVPEPINIRIINHILTETLKHPALAAQAQQVMGAGVDWVKNAFLDHGFNDNIATVTAAAIRQAASDAAMQEKIELERQGRAEMRRTTLRRYELGMLSTDHAVDLLKNDYVTEQMALDMLENVDEQIRADFVLKATMEVKAAFMEGKLTPEQVGLQLGVLGVNSVRQTYYMQEWVWARNDRRRTLATGEIMALVKKGMMLPAVALARLVNLGWTEPDAMLELAVIENEIAEAKAKELATESAKAIAEKTKAAREQEAKAKAAETAKAKKEAAEAKTAKAKELAPLEQEALTNKYTAAALTALNAWKAASTKGDDNKANAEIAKAAAAYADLLLAQLKLIQAEPEVKDEIEPIAAIEVPPVEKDQGSNKDTTSPSPPPSTTPTSSGGTSAPPSPG